MSKKLSLVPAIELLEAAYEKAIPLFPEEEQKVLRKVKPLIVIQTAGVLGKKLTLGWHAETRWTRGKEKIAELTITAEHLKDDFYRIMDTLVHEMVHHANDLLKRNDVSSNGYHNRVFADLAEKVGLQPKRLKGKGFAATEPTDGFKKVVDTWGLNPKAFDTYRGREQHQHKGSKLKKFACKCGYGIRIAVDPSMVDLTCNICGGQVKPKEKR